MPKKEGENGSIIDVVDGVYTLFHYDEMEDRTIIETVQDVEPILDANKAAFNSGHDGYTPSRDLKFVAEIPVVVIEKWLREDGIDVWDPNHKEAVKRKLNDPEWRHLRTAPGRL